MDAFEDHRPAIDCVELLPEPVAAALRDWQGPMDVQQLRYVDTAPAIADTALLVEHYGSWLLDLSANCVVAAGKRGDNITLAGCVVLSTTRVDVNGVVRRELGARKASFAPMDAAIGGSGMEYGGITPIGLPADWPLLVDAAVADTPYVLIGSGARRGKLIVPGKALAALPGARVLEGLGRAAG
ncbi:YbaK/EbsC family protein [Streptomyces niger]|uniref:YbaK/EbsC family protein n=1 Tax=Streptomyces niger TaxID=66373 RepID=UPI000699C53F|nr:YbaK/EbsC family protein [Streptomyces niger]